MPSSKPCSRSDNCKYWKREPDCESSNEKEKIMVKRNWWKSPIVNATCDKNCGKEKLIISRHWKSKSNESVIVRNDPTKRRIRYKPQIHYEPTETFDYCADPYCSYLYSSSSSSCCSSSPPSPSSSDLEDEATKNWPPRSPVQPKPRGAGWRRDRRKTCNPCDGERRLCFS
ncbi:hypothetical protein SprV_0200814800 [Sparganum proliferum]